MTTVESRGPAGGLWTTLPRLVPARLGLVRAALADGAYLRAWPVAAVGLPLTALIVGVVCGWRPWESSGPLSSDVTYTSSIVVMAVLTLVGGVGAGVGCWALVGYVVAELLLRDHLPRYSSGTFVGTVLQTYPPLLLAYLFLAVLIVLIPLLANRLGRTLVGRIRLGGSAAPPASLAAGAGALVAVALVWSWTHTVPMLIRPVYTWRGDSPPTSAIAPVQDDGWVLIVLAAVVIAGRIVLEDIARRRGVHDPVVAPASARRPWPAWVSIPLRTAVTTFVLAGMFTEYWHAAAFAAVFASALVARTALSGRSTWTALVNRVPVAIRLLVAVGASYLVGMFAVDALWRSTETFLPILIGAAVSLLLFAILVPSSTRETAR